MLSLVQNILEAFVPSKTRELIIKQIKQRSVTLDDGLIVQSRTG